MVLGAALVLSAGPGASGLFASSASSLGTSLSSIAFVASASYVGKRGLPVEREPASDRAARGGQKSLPIAGSIGKSPSWARISSHLAGNTGQRSTESHSSTSSSVARIVPTRAVSPLLAAAHGAA